MAGTCVLAQIVLFVVGVVLASFQSEEPSIRTLGQLVGILFSLANLLMWISLFAPSIYNWLRGRNDSADQLLIVGQLAELLRLGVALPDALQSLSRHQHSRWRSRFSQGCQFLQSMAESTREGDTLGQAMERVAYFPAHWARLLQAAERRGVLLEVLQSLENGRARQSWFGLWFGLRLILIWLFGFPIALFLATYILPTFVTLFEGMNLALPYATRALIFLVRLARSPLGALVLTALPLALVAAAFWAQHKPEFGARLRRLVSAFPPFRLVWPLEDQAAVATTLATCLQLGLSEEEALQVAALSARHPAYVKALSGSGGIDEALQRHPELFAAPLRWLAAQGQRHGNLEQALHSAAVHLLDLAEEKKARWKVWLDALSVCLLGGLALVMAISVMAPLGMLIAAFLEQLVLP